MTKRIAAVGVELASSSVEHIELLSRKSLLDWDIVIFRPNVNGLEADSHYNGRRSFGAHYSTQIKDAQAHWRQQIEAAVKSGTTVFIFLCSPEQFWIETGKKQYSGTGKSARATTIVTDLTNYDLAPVPPGWNAAEGSEMVLDPIFREILGSYWDRFGKSSVYHVSWSPNQGNRCIGTRAGGRTTGICVKADEHEGGLVFLPDLNFDDDSFADLNDDEDDLEWTKEGKIFAESLVSELVEVTRRINSTLERSAAPSWVSDAAYVLPAEKEIRNTVVKIEGEIDRLNRERSEKLSELDEVERMKGLLYESGKPLEHAILLALRVLGFSAENFTDETMELDAVFASEEGRLIGEAEGKDNKQVNITKLRQLSVNIEEDFEREEITVRAKGVLFGNAFRFTPPDEREPCFTDKCITSAQVTSIALIDTVSLFRVASYCLRHNDESVAKAFRQKLFSESGVIQVFGLLSAEAVK
ncbi:hypothetical protein [Rhodobacter sp. SY28-1]|uniref:hypothetical protein n=1 Tax=Rhodobacter sp. SY28-1 TaxID=2562317 RepID=UPI0010C062B2|nr:hypothetical protein [Rhodobacter sp. SY28-1]